MQDAAGANLDQTINDRAGGDLHVQTTGEEQKGGDVIDVRNSEIKKDSKETHPLDKYHSVFP